MTPSQTIGSLLDHAHCNTPRIPRLDRHLTVSRPQRLQPPWPSWPQARCSAWWATKYVPPPASFSNRSCEHMSTSASYDCSRVRFNHELRSLHWFGSASRNLCLLIAPSRMRLATCAAIKLDD